VRPYTAIFIGFLAVLILEILSSILKESKLKGLYRMVFVDSISRRLSSDPGSKEFKRNKVNSENSSEFTVPKKAWKFGMGFMSGGHNFVQRSVVPVGVSSSTALRRLGVYL